MTISSKISTNSSIFSYFIRLLALVLQESGKKKFVGFQIFEAILISEDNAVPPKEAFTLVLSCFRSSFCRNISTTSARVLSGVPNTEKQMKARGRFGRVLLLFRGVWNA